MFKKPAKYDFSGWATKYGTRCSDGLTIQNGAFDSQDGCRVPLVMSHSHTSADSILGYAILEKRNEGLYTYGVFNNTSSGRAMKEAVRHGDITSLSICANNLDRVDNYISHGTIREVSLVLAGANPGAFIESVIYHGEPLDYDETEGIIYSGEGLSLRQLQRRDADPTGGYDNIKHADSDPDEDEDKTVAEVLNTLNDEQKAAVAIMIGAVKEEMEDEEEDNKMKHNMFVDEYTGESGGIDILSHEDQAAIFEEARRCGHFKDAYNSAVEELNLEHSIDTTGMVTPTGTNNYGVRDLSMLFPDSKSVALQPDFISRDMGWVTEVMGSVHRTPFSRIRSIHADITEDEARARGYMKGNKKKEEVFTLLKRSTGPTTIYKKQKVDRDDILDVTDFDVALWIKGEMEIMLREEFARAILVGDGRPADSDDKIKEDCIRPIAKDVSLYSIKNVVDVNYGEAKYAKKVIDSIIKSRKEYKGSGSPVFFTTEDLLTDMLLLEDEVGHKLYKTEQELATTLRVRKIVPVSVMENQKINYSNKDYMLGGIIVNLADYNVGTDRGGEQNMFEGFDIDYNQLKYLMETRASGALIKPFSAITILMNSTTPTVSGARMFASRSLSGTTNRL